MSLLANQRKRSSVEIIDASVHFFRAHALSLLAIAAVVVIPPAVLEVFVPPTMKPLFSLAENLLLTLAGGAASVYVTTLLTGTELSVGESFGRVSRRFGRILTAQVGYGLALILGLVLLVIPGLIFGSRLALATTIAAVEDDEAAKKALERSWRLTKGHAMHVLGTLFVTVLVWSVVVFGGSFVLGLITGALGLADSLTDLLVASLTIVAAPFVWTVSTLLYIDVRVRVEGADIEAMVAELPRASAGTPVA
jgi:hypothetical protein